ncbi:MAG: HAMP domain-containing histidine kinase [Chloroflexi bacterium]|nr:HAMP domain-containing histidine kinase [Chloroflexota bacterium]OJV87041.1 MAG: hypothetical protein BGO39_33295 [Chloroflexi bacterium 54-19]
MINTQLNPKPHTHLRLAEPGFLNKVSEKIKGFINSAIAVGKSENQPGQTISEIPDSNVAELVRVNQELEERLKEKTRVEQELRRANEELAQAIEKEKKLHELKTKFLSMASHEFRTPLTTVMMATDMLETFGSTLSVSQKDDFLERIKVSTELMTELMNEILQYSRIDNGLETLVSKEVDLTRFCSELVDEARLISGSCHNIIFLVQEETDGSIFYGDPLVLRQILNNLLSNALKYSPNGGTIKLFLKLSENLVTFEVEDQGIGIPDSEINSLFEAFKRGANVRNIQGTGLGLAIVKKYVELYGGSIKVKSDVNRGSTFSVNLPLTQSATKQFHFSNPI